MRLVYMADMAYYLYSVPHLCIFENNRKVLSDNAPPLCHHYNDHLLICAGLTKVRCAPLHKLNANCTCRGEMLPDRKAMTSTQSCA
jgi:hypothetical protein